MGGAERDATGGVSRATPATVGHSAEEVVRYYDDAYYFLGRSMAMSQCIHYGFWDRKTRNIYEAMRLENQTVASWAGIPRGAKVVDAGCGVGGSSIHLAKTLGCHAIGLTLSARQVATAKANAARNGVSDLTDFLVADYGHTNLPSAAYDAVWAMESYCITADKLPAVQEAYRLLRPGGTLVVADYFAREEPFSAREQRLIEAHYRGWVFGPLDTQTEFRRLAELAGFAKCEFRDATPLILPSARLFAREMAPILPLARALAKFPGKWGVRGRHMVSGVLQYDTLKQGLWGFSVFTAQKPLAAS